MGNGVSSFESPGNPSHSRGIHSRNKKAMEFIARGWSALREVDRVIDYTELRDPRLIPLLRTAKENFELALEVDNMNTHARYWLSKLHFKYHVPGACKAVGAALLVEAANMGDPDAQYELGCHLRVQNENVQSDQQAFYYIEKAVDQKDVASAMWCFYRASTKGHAGAAIAYGALLLRGAEVPEAVRKFNAKLGRGSAEVPPVEMAREQFRRAADAGCDLGLHWLRRIEAADEGELHPRSTVIP
ncbi:unnamed protein product [Spirodela intermedia]|uniref:Uncharacterized protein n=1 Tax=Spirodela intermedia TaxID=51605 RepID=A0A7I8JJ83_SPIIN|nr:unnamed protein product [Spirodela intermedia]CAA6669931.1 unnamed protein product [Spirodela intermedia]